MKDYLKIKEKLFEECVQFNKTKCDTINKSIASNKNDLLSETKSSAGDKHETGRAMIQLEMEKASQQFYELKKMKEVLDKIDIEKSSELACLGSIIKTTKGDYFLAISVGQVIIENEIYFVVSPQSPIGSHLLGKKAGDDIPFNNSIILEIA